MTTNPEMKHDYHAACAAARGLWAGTDTAEQAEKINPEYLAGQVQLIRYMGHPYGEDDPDHVYWLIARDIFAGG